MNFGKVTVRDFSMEVIKFWNDFSPKPSILVITSLYCSKWNKSANSVTNPLAINFSIVASDNPSMFIASLLTNNVKDFIFFARHSGLIQYNDFTPLSWLILVSP